MLQYGEEGINPSSGEEKPAVEALLVGLDLDHTSYRLGNTQIFLRGGVLSSPLLIVNLQVLARGYERAAKPKIQTFL